MTYILIALGGGFFMILEYLIGYQTISKLLDISAPMSAHTVCTYGWLN
jgi:hypothetical protein